MYIIVNLVQKKIFNGYSPTGIPLFNSPRDEMGGFDIVQIVIYPNEVSAVSEANYIISEYSVSDLKVIPISEMENFC